MAKMTKVVVHDLVQSVCVSVCNGERAVLLCITTVMLHYVAFISFNVLGLSLKQESLAPAQRMALPRFHKLVHLGSLGLEGQPRPRLCQVWG